MYINHSLADVEERMAGTTAEALIDGVIEGEAVGIDGSATIVFEVEVREAVGAVDSVVAQAEGVCSHGWKDAGAFRIDVTRLAGEASSSLGIVGCAVGGDLVADARDGVKAR
jgi:hypothetical protein